MQNQMNYGLENEALNELDKSLSHFGEHANGWKPHEGGLTKHEVFALLALEGVRRGYVPIAEYSFQYTGVVEDGQTKKKNIDIVWAKRVEPKNELVDQVGSLNQVIWEVVAAFEIEGYDNGYVNGGDIRPCLRFDVVALATVQLKSSVPVTAIVFYSCAYDRSEKLYKIANHYEQRTENLHAQIHELDNELRERAGFNDHKSTEILMDCGLIDWFRKLNLKHG